VSTLLSLFFSIADALCGEYNRVMKTTKVFAIPFAKLYPLYVQKAARKGRTEKEVVTCMCWLTGYTPAGVKKQIKNGVDLHTFFREAPKMHPNATKITGMICGYRIEDITDPLMQKIRYMDKLIDELAKGRAMEKILRV
jgi:hypothetical protein